MKTEVNYYAIIPANVRYDKGLSANAKLLYGELTALANKEGYCFASNSYFAELYKTHISSISRWIKELNDKGYIRSVMQYREGTKEIESRRIYISDPISKNANTYAQKCHDPISKNAKGGIRKNAKDNNTSINNTSINNNILSSKPDPVPYQEIIEYLNLKAGKQYRYTTKDTQRYIKSRWAENFTLDDFKKVIDNKVADWKMDAKMNEYLRPSTLFGTKFESYLNSDNKAQAIPFKRPVKQELVPSFIGKEYQPPKEQLDEAMDKEIQDRLAALFGGANE